ncbi:unnamed protein product [Onchocerca ochengi]|uniref:Uncharacterized protein n=1 Tax=Onchocerca ochengi TaxID=42157 RepID=A0A182EI26_ONCOC|nr:unnamed protein product [Onchocerca ochengi]
MFHFVRICLVDLNCLSSETKLIIVFRGNALSSSDIESITNTKIAPFADNRSVFVCYALHVGENSRSRIRRSSSFVMFSGKNVEASTFLIETTDEEKLREKLLKWKSKLDFLGSHHIIPFYFTKQSMEPTNSEEIFKETFGIQPTTLRLSASELAETGLIYWNSTTSATRNPGSVYAIVANERKRQKMAQMQAERHATRLEDAQLRAVDRATLDPFRSEPNERYRLRVAERCQRETGDQHRTRLHVVFNADKNLLIPIADLL